MIGETIVTAIGGKVTDCLAELAFEAGKKHYKERLNEQRVNELLRGYIERQEKYNGLCSLAEEYDFEGLSKYIGGDFLDDVLRNAFGVNAQVRKKGKQAIIDAAIRYSQANSRKSKYKVKKIVSHSLEIIYSFYHGGIQESDLLLAAEIVDAVSAEIKRAQGSIVDRFHEVEHSVRTLDDTVKASEKKILKEINSQREERSVQHDLKTAEDVKEFIRRQRDMIQDQAIFPWFHDSYRYREAFPNLFVHPKFKERDKDCTYRDLIAKITNNIAVLGVAGAGKSTLLRYLFAFDPPTDDCIYLTAKDTKKSDTETRLDQIMEVAHNTETQFLIFIDGIDEVFYNDPDGFEALIERLKIALNCHFWLGCREDFYKRSCGEKTNFAAHSYTIQPWDPTQINHFIDKYSELASVNDLEEKIHCLISEAPDAEKFLSNPFHLSLLSFLAESTNKEPSDSGNPGLLIHGIYDLYDQFVQKWIKREKERGTSPDSNDIIIETLQRAAFDIYYYSDFQLDEISENNTAINALLQVTKTDSHNNMHASLFYHRSLAAFFLAQSTVEAMLNGEIERLRELLSRKMIDDVTNFVSSYIAVAKENQLVLIKDHLQELYRTIPDEEKRTQEHVIYFITRLGVDVSDFLAAEVAKNPQHRTMRLSLAYGCVLSMDPVARAFALEYAKSIANETKDAETNRGWTVVYFGDINADPYEYLDDEQCSWANARQARLNRFTKKNPRKKDYLFRLFDIPLFHSFLKNRGWNDISEGEYDILYNVEFPTNIFNPDEMDFLVEQKAILLKEYRSHLDAQTKE